MSFEFLFDVSSEDEETGVELNLSFEFYFDASLDDDKAEDDLCEF